MIRACIFDFDGVMIDNERFWDEEKPNVFEEVYSREIADKLTKTSGLSMDQIHALAVSYGSKTPIQAWYDACNTHANTVYSKAPITDGLNEFLDTLLAKGIRMAIVSASPKYWMDIALSRLRNSSVFKTIISLNDRKDLAHKPAPDGYLTAMKILGVTPKETIIIEDSNTGIKSAKAAGAFTIGLRQNHVDGYTIEGADAYVDTIGEVLKYL